MVVIEPQAYQWRLIRLNLAVAIPNCQADWVADLSVALDYLHKLGENQLPDLILVDLDLPRREDGFALLQAIKEDTLLQSVPFVAFSNSDQQEDITRAYHLGCRSYLLKPDDPSEWRTFFLSIMAYWGLDQGSSF